MTDKEKIKMYVLKNKDKVREMIKENVSAKKLASTEPVSRVPKAKRQSKSDVYEVQKKGRAGNKDKQFRNKSKGVSHGS